MTRPSIGIVDYGIGNLRSVANALALTGGQPRIVARPADIGSCDGIVLPGVGAFAPAIAALRASEMVPALTRHVERGKALLGICLGMQLLCRRSFENGENAGLNWIAADVLPLPAEAGIKVPHMGWNTLQATQPHPLLSELAPESDAYFLHSFRVACETPENVIATCTYGVEFAAVVGSGAVYGMQFHPEKSQDTGLLLLRNFIRESVRAAHSEQVLE